MRLHLTISRTGGGATIRQEVHEFSVSTRGRGLYELTDGVIRWVRGTGIVTGLLTLHIRHTSASLLVQENADPTVKTDLDAFLTRLVPDGDRLYRHRSEGPDDMPSHVRAALTAVGLSLPVTGGVPALGTWQGIYVFEHRTTPHRRTVAAHLIGE